MNKELLLIRMLAKIDSTKEEIEAAKIILRSDINWGLFLDEVFKNKVNNLVLFNLQKYQLWEYIPWYIKCIFITCWKENVLKTNAYFSYIEKIVDMLNKTDITYALIKGFDLIDKLYVEKSQYIRTFNDLDILIEPKNLSKVEDIFLEEGFVFGDFDFSKNEILPASRYDIIKMKMTSHQIYTLVKKVNYDKEGIFTGPIFVDINFTIFDGGKNIPSIDTENILATSSKRKAFNGVEYKTLDIYYTFVQLTCHLYREAHTQEFKEQNLDVTLQKFCDIYQYLIWIKDKWDVTRLNEIIHSANLEEVFWFVLYFTDMLYETKFVSTILQNKVDYKDKYIVYIHYFKEKFEIR